MGSIAELLSEGIARHKAGDLASAAALYRRIVQEDPNHADAWSYLGVSLEAQGRLAEAEESFRQSLLLVPANADTQYNLGVTLARLGKLDEAAKCYAQAIRLQPDLMLARVNLGNVLAALGKTDDAIACYRQVLALKPDYAEVHSNLGIALSDIGKFEEAAACHAEAIHLKPNLVDAHYNLGNTLVRLNRVNDALASYEYALFLDPGFVKAHISLAHRLSEIGKLAEAELHLREAYRLSPTARNRVALATLFPAIVVSHEDALAWRQRLSENVRHLVQEGVTIDLSHEPGINCFHAVYQGLNDRDLQRDLAALHTAPAQDTKLSHTSRTQGAKKIRIGFISSFFKEHTIARLMHGVIAQLSRRDFDVTVLSVGRHDDPMADQIRQHADQFVEVSPRPAAARELVADQNLDILYYTDIGMDRLIYSLAFSRLAPVQLVTWGHPVTTGIPTIDYFISSELLESKESDQHYTEKLVLLKSIAVYYHRPAPPPSIKPRSHFGLPESGALYMCPQSLFKIHPEFDEILAGILRSDPSGTVALLGGQHSYWDELLRQRFATSMPDVQDRIRFMPRQDHSGFMNLTALADVLLDPIHFGGGNTSYEGFALGVPIVTLPSPFLRGRITLALYKLMGVMDAVVSSPEEYVARAVELGTDVDAHSKLSQKILASNNVLFENSAGVRELEQFFQQALAQAR